MLESEESSDATMHSEEASLSKMSSPSVVYIYIIEFKN